MIDIQNNWPSGIKRTKSRECVLSVLESSTKPLSAMEILSEIEQRGHSTWLSTVYRTLELFVKMDVVAKITVHNNETSLFELNRFQHKHYAVCLLCKKIISMENCPMEKFIPQIQDKEFQVMGHNIEVYGYCKNCSPK